MSSLVSGEMTIPILAGSPCPLPPILNSCVQNQAQADAV